MKTKASLTLRKELRACLAIAYQAILLRRSQGSNALTWFFLGMAVLAVGIMLVTGVRWQYALGYGAGVPLTFVAMAWWIFMVGSLSRQNTAASRLIPAMRIRLICVLIGTGLLITVVVGGLLALAVPVTHAPLIAVALATGLLLLGSTLGVAAANIVWPIMIFIHWPRETSLMEVLASAGGDRLLLGGAMLVPLVWYLGMTYLLNAQPQPGFTGRIQALLDKQPAARARSGAPGKDAGRILLFGLGPRLEAPWHMVSRSFLGVVLVACVIVFLNWDLLTNYLVAGQIGVLVIALMIPLSRALNTEAAVHASQCEQPLLRLAPGTPVASHLNQVLAHALLREYLKCWASWSVAGLALYWLTGASAMEVARMAPVFLVSAGAGSIMLSDYARARTPHRWRSFWWLALFALPILGVCIAHKLLSNPALLVLAVGGVALAAWQIRRRLAIMGNAPVAFPSRRLL